MKKNAYYFDCQRLRGVGYKRYLKKFFWLLRRSQSIQFKPVQTLIKFVFRVHCMKNKNEIGSSTKIGYGFCLWHPFNITIANDVVIGNNVTLSKGCVLGREYRGQRKGVPTIGNKVWIGTNSVIVGKITIGDNVLIAPNAFVNCDVPSNSIVIGNPAIIKHSDHATERYIQNPQMCELYEPKEKNN